MFKPYITLIAIAVHLLQTHGYSVKKLPLTEEFAAERQPRIRTPRQSFDFNKDLISTSDGHGISAGMSGSNTGVFQGSLQGQVGLLNHPDHHLQAFARHQKTFGTKLQQLAPDVNTIGLNYQHGSGAEAFVGGSNPAGTPFITASGGASIPFNEGRTRLGTTYSNTFGGGIQPRQQFGLTVSHNY